MKDIKKKEKSSFFKNVKKTLPYIKSAKYNLLGYTLVSITEAIISAILPIFSAKIILNINNGFVDELILAAIFLFFIEIIIRTSYYFKGTFYEKIYMKVLNSMQNAIARETLKLEVQEIDKNTSGLFIDRLNNDTSDMSGIFMEYTYWISNVLSNVGVLIAVFILNKYMFIYAIITSTIIYLIKRRGIKEEYDAWHESKSIDEKKTGLISEVIRGIRDIKVLNAQENILKQTKEKIENSTRKQIKVLEISYFYDLMERLLKALVDLGFIILGAMLYKNSLLTVSAFIILYNYQTKIKNLLEGIGYISEYNKKFNVAADRIYEIVDSTKFKKEQFGNKKIKKIQGNIKFDNVTFGYDENKIIKNMSFEIKPNEHVSFVGKSGVGKTTIFNLIAKLYNTNEGNIYLDGYNINDLTCDSLRNNMSIITQSPYIFNFSIKDNLLLAKANASLKEIREACKLACIDDYIMSLPDKYDTLLGEGGITLSGGQKQRLAIARALLMKTEIILFDEATSALDNETQREIQNAINNLKGEYTILIIAHRLSTVIDSNRIFLIEDGKISASGSHKELLKKSKEYKQLYNRDLEK